MAGVLCEQVGPGMRASERAVTVRDIRGHSELLLVENDFLSVQGDKTYLPVGVVFRDRDKGVALIEFAEEADSGAWRAWVPLADFLKSETAA